MSEKAIFWFRQDLRLSDNPALSKACTSKNVLPIYVFDDNIPKKYQMGAASKVWLHHSLQELDKSLENKLNIYKGNPQEIILKLIKEYNVDLVCWNRCYEPNRISDDKKLKSEIKNLGIECQSFNGSLLWEPWEVLKNDNTPYKVFTPFYKNGCLKSDKPRKVIKKPILDNILKDKNNKITINDLKLLPSKKENGWEESIISEWNVGEASAYNKFKYFLGNKINEYKKGRDFPSFNLISRLSPHLHFGEISPHQIWHAVQNKLDENIIDTNNSENFLSEIGWREFSYYLLFHFNKLPSKNFQEKFDNFPWGNNKSFLKAWQKGQTGYPIVDAGMRELWQTGFMHNRVRMIVASFLIKNLLVDWRLGAEWFWDCLFDADLASNSASWQWVAGSGADAAPYFRIFNPILQGEKFDKTGEYTRKYVPELKNLPDKYLFNPFDAPDEVLKKANIKLGKDYPMPIIDLKKSRDFALEAYKNI